MRSTTTGDVSSEGPPVPRAARAASPREETAGGSGTTDEDRSEPIESNVIDVRDLRKEYGDFAAVEGSTFAVEPGEVFGVVGPNGAGKMTTLKSLAGLLEPTSGGVEVAGRAPDDADARGQLGFPPRSRRYTRR